MSTILDVRTPEEYAEGHLDGAVNIDAFAPDFAEQLVALPQDEDYRVYCKAGGRAAKAVGILEDAGYRAENLGGLGDAAAETGLPVLID